MSVYIISEQSSDDQKGVTLAATSCVEIMLPGTRRSCRKAFDKA
jgi:hypothetical protein